MIVYSYYMGASCERYAPERHRKEGTIVTMADYNKTINLPKTDFPMRAKLAQREPGMLEEMNRKDLYRKVMERNKDKTPFILHDGPPYANGDIHIGTAMNKILKDMIIKSRNLMGWKTGYIPGWDCHGLPIEHNVELELGDKKKDLRAEVPRHSAQGIQASRRSGRLGTSLHVHGSGL